VRDLYSAASNGDCAYDHARYLKSSDERKHSHDVHKRVDSPDLMKVDLLDRTSVDVGLDLCQPAYGGERRRDDRLRQRGRRDNVLHLVQMAQLRRCRVDYSHPRAGDTPFAIARHLHRDSLDAESSHGLLQHPLQAAFPAVAI
jgi:hypothetical protein